LEFKSQLPIRDPGLITNPLRVNTDGGDDSANIQSLQTEAFSPDKSFDTSFCSLPQKPQLAAASIFVRNSELCSIQLEQIAAVPNPGSKNSTSLSPFPQKLHSDGMKFIIRSFDNFRQTSNLL
jgi:hypothetical protein